MKYNMDQLVQRGHHFAIVDEVDSILIDEARTPLIISGQVEDKSQLYNKIDKIIPKISLNHIDIDEKSKNVTLTDEGNEFLDELLVQPAHLNVFAIFVCSGRDNSFVSYVPPQY